MKTFFEELFDYNLLVNDKLIKVIKDNTDKIDSRTAELISHIFLVHKNWNNRMQQQQGLTDFWHITSVDDLPGLNVEYTKESKSLIQNNDLDNSFTYRNTEGAEFRNTYVDGLFHIINHSNYHRGQINARLKASGIEPVITDYIFYRR